MNDHEYQRMKDTWWILWNATLHELHNSFIRAQPEPFWAGVRRLHSRLGQAIHANRLPPICQHCVHWRREVCKRESSPHHMLRRGAGCTCESYAQKPTGL